MRTHTLPFHLSRDSHVSLPQQLVQGVVSAIRAGVFPRGVSLPGSRTLARQLGVHRNTTAYRVKRIEEITGWDLREPDLRLALSLALRILDAEGGPESAS